MTPGMWYAARAAGIVAWLLVTASVVWGLLLSTRLTTVRPARWMLDLHRFLGGLAVTFTAVHVAALVADTYVHFGAADVLLPFASRWRPGAVALGVVGMWLLAAVELTSLLMRRLPRRAWRAVHMSSYGLYALATLHGVTAGSDLRGPLGSVGVEASAAVVLFLSLVRVLSPKPARRPAARTA
ncbi:MAG TPA: ferric reductase-like transmembrane domain-containing protein [Acidimicrobiales bacterium]|nr:ferric reductase-like transmembrane domain-containing protein [Acidimicrobiales bacterium]